MLCVPVCFNVVVDMCVLVFVCVVLVVICSVFIYMCVLCKCLNVSVFVVSY